MNIGLGKTHRCGTESRNAADVRYSPHAVRLPDVLEASGKVYHPNISGGIS